LAVVEGVHNHNSGFDRGSIAVDFSLRIMNGKSRFRQIVCPAGFLQKFFSGNSFCCAVAGPVALNVTVSSIATPILNEAPAQIPSFCFFFTGASTHPYMM
jgi:hypothetical protein